MRPDTDLREALLDPGAAFDSPESVLTSGGLSKSLKIEILRRWAYDARELAVAEEEGMPTAQDSLLQRILLALAQLGADADLERGAPTKQSGV